MTRQVNQSRPQSNCTRRDSNPQPSVPKTDALSVELQVHDGDRLVGFAAGRWAASTASASSERPTWEICVREPPQPRLACQQKDLRNSEVLPPDSRLRLSGSDRPVWDTHATAPAIRSADQQRGGDHSVGKFSRWSSQSSQNVKSVKALTRCLDPCSVLQTGRMPPLGLEPRT